MNWKALKQFNELFEKGETTIDLLKLPLGKRILDLEYIKVSSNKSLAKTNHYDTFYSQSISIKYCKYKSLIEKYNLNDTNFDETELDALYRIEKDRDVILDMGKSQKEIATLFFDDAKYLKKPSKLFDAVLKMLNVSELPVDEHDQQFLKVLHCKNKFPKAVILCENLNKLSKPRMNDVELWYAGGRNTAKLKYIVEPTIPFYYLCDWDNRGIEIYQGIKKNFFPNIEILVPKEPIKLLNIISDWKTQIDLSLFKEDAILLINKLIPDKWIEEESINHPLLNK